MPKTHLISGTIRHRRVSQNLLHNRILCGFQGHADPLLYEISGLARRTPHPLKRAPLREQEIDAYGRAYATGKRKNAIMSGMAAPLAEDDMKHIAAFYASKKPVTGFAKQKDTVALGEQIYRGGIASKQVPACSGCHSPNGAGIPAKLRHAGCGHDVQPQVVCGHCGDALTLGEIEHRRGPGRLSRVATSPARSWRRSAFTADTQHGSHASLTHIADIVGDVAVDLEADALDRRRATEVEPFGLGCQGPAQGGGDGVDATARRWTDAIWSGSRLARASWRPVSAMRTSACIPLRRGFRAMASAKICSAVRASGVDSNPEGTGGSSWSVAKPSAVLSCARIGWRESSRLAISVLS